MTAPDPIVPVLLEKVYGLIQDKIETPQQSLVEVFAQRLLGQLAEDDLLQRNESDLYGAVLSLWHHLVQNKPDQISVRVYNPTLSRYGWQSTHTVVEIITPDRPFLVDSVRMTLNRLGITSHLMLNGPYFFKRNAEGVITEACGKDGDLQTLFHIEVDRLNDKQELEALKQELEQVLQDVDLVVNDWQLMQAKLQSIVEELKNANMPVKKDKREEAIAFLDWVTHHNFTFMGYHNYDLVPIEGDYELRPTNEDGLGLLSKSSKVKTLRLSELPETARFEARKPDLLILTKGNVKSKIHRPAYTDYIGIKRFDKDGNVIGEHRFTGLYASTAYNQSIMSIPLISNKVNRILEESGYSAGSHSWKALNNLMETYPRDELIQASEKEMLDVGCGVVRMQDRDLLRLFVRRDPFGRFFSCMVYVTKERYNTELRRKTQRVLKEYFGSEQDVEFTTFFSESPLARTHYIVRVENNNFDVDVKAIEHNLVEAASSWEDRLSSSLIANFGESQGTLLAKNYARAFPRSYKEQMLPGFAVADIEQLESLSEDNKLGMLFYRPQEEATDSRYVKLKLFHRDEPIHLSDVMPMLENLGLRVIGEEPYEVKTASGTVYWILDFAMLHNACTGIDLAEARDRFQEAFSAIWHGEIESDGFNRLVLCAGLTGREITILRSFARYMRQVGFPFSQHYIEETLSNHNDLARDLVQLFRLRFDPEIKHTEKAEQDLIAKLHEKLDEVESLDDDRIIRRYMEMIRATQRTNYYQLDENGQPKPWLSLKLRPSEIPEIPAPVPFFEIFVYAPDMEGVHLRGGKVARGGLRWSDRQEDFRTEILGLVKAQQVKNTVIVPVGAKGGFICKRQPQLSTREEIWAEGQRCYKRFIRALLDVTDNIVDGDLIPPANVVRHDEDDPYLVVAADKGTATFSDLANSVSEDYNFWLGDAFASGGSNGYDHKAMGITAKGGWESVKRHFREIGIDCQNTDFTCAGIGDMAGDVFGNGMLLSKHTRLVAAFNHMHIFLDPNPDAATSWEERNRLFNLPRSSWEDYNPELISEGGGVFSRRSKAIKLTPQIQKLLGTRKQTMPPNELIRLILTMEVDLLWNGGIGTYVKSQAETHTDVGDRANDGLRINGSELRAKIVGEGGNLGMTQLGRVEFAKNGGRVNTDFIDNVGGVDCSDNEVNIKILLNTLVAGGDLTYKQRNELLERMEDEVSEIVLDDAYCQSESISVTQHQEVQLLKEQIRFIHHMEKAGKLDRALENIPDDDALAEREKSGMGLTRPELAVLVAYGKMVLKEEMATDEIANDPYHARLLPAYFPKELQERFRTQMDQHPLRKELIATSLANQMSNEMGCNFVTRLQEETGATVAEISSAYSVGRAIFDFAQYFEQVRELDNVIPADVQYDIMYRCRRMLRRATRWILRNRDRKLSIEEQIAFYQPVVSKLRENLERYLVTEEVKEHNDQAESMIKQGVPAELAHNIARLSSLYSAMDIAQITSEMDKDIDLISRVYFVLGAELSLHWFLKQVHNQPVENHWQALARASFREDLDWQQRQLTSAVISSGLVGGDAEGLIESWMKEHKKAIRRWNTVLTEFKVGTTHEFAKFSVALRELMLLNLHCRPAM
ncbi:MULTISPECIES: NAD-glutamate dehydrogenase [Photobacterium]|uniref:NAD-glutamate dehydrogenase n=1 Tax=Photobacterium ganghwense TaxID=320778 RepID=A0A0J1H567_9GAMM|nr:MULTISPECIES: NAD-glutamate dehydrogenase [Photobacterium]KLV06880.1 NAD-glutamate dehydrogenase [Photobacterium ganghwense]MBV1841356.1 NAD-glutamate dehydrogenase [Photobacterium ganghwense]PSU10587.1 NAD-glutamate dehydrogenase [Photobacterium ganghwense]QSV15487.1 NAD-glutamate dehydrogenase [Photobacterium ganghwense]